MTLVSSASFQCQVNADTNPWNDIPVVRDDTQNTRKLPRIEAVAEDCGEQRRRDDGLAKAREEDDQHQRGEDDAKVEGAGIKSQR